MNTLKTIGISIIVLSTLALCADAHAQEPTAVRGLNDIAPGISMRQFEMSCLSSTSTPFLWRGPGTGLPVRSVDDAAPFPDGSIVIIQNRTASSYARCCVADNPNFTIPSVDTATIADTYDGPNGDGPGSCHLIQDSAWALKIDRATMAQVPGYHSAGICSQATPFDRAPDYRLYVPCTNNAHCANVAGMTGAATCVTDPTLIDNLMRRISGIGGKKVQFIKCRCSTTVSLTATQQR